MRSDKSGLNLKPLPRPAETREGRTSVKRFTEPYTHRDSTATDVRETLKGVPQYLEALWDPETGKPTLYYRAPQQGGKPAQSTALSEGEIISVYTPRRSDMTPPKRVTTGQMSIIEVQQKGQLPVHRVVVNGKKGPATTVETDHLVTTQANQTFGKLSFTS